MTFKSQVPTLSLYTTHNNFLSLMYIINIIVCTDNKNSIIYINIHIKLLLENVFFYSKHI